MGLRDLLYGDEPILRALERIATALEVLAKLERPSGSSQDTSAAFYTDDELEFARELRREAYTERTGQTLSEGEDPPSHGTDAFQT